MTVTELKELFNYLVDDDNVDDDDVLRLLNIADQRIHALRDWEYLGKEDRSQTVVSGTTQYNLPSDFMFLKIGGDRSGVELYNSSNDSYESVSVVPYAQRNAYNGQSKIVFVDNRQEKVTFTSNPSNNAGELIVISYQYQPAEFTSGNEDTDEPVFPRQFHPLVAYEAAKFYYFNDQPEKDRAWNNELARTYDEMLKQMIRWDNNLKLANDGEWNPAAYMPMIP